MGEESMLFEGIEDEFPQVFPQYSGKPPAIEVIG
jgi:hypothetical protein